MTWSVRLAILALTLHSSPFTPHTSAQRPPAQPNAAEILHKMQKEAPDKELIPAPPEDESCSCNVCPHMRRNTLEKLYLALRDLQPQVDVPEAVRVRALKPIQRMLEMSV